MSNKTIKVCIDPGHGGKDPGANAYGVKEKEVVLAVALEVGKILESYGVSVIFTRRDDTFLALADRANLANKTNVDSYISIHVNAASNSKARGVETFHHTKRDLTESRRLASAIQNTIVGANIFTSNRGIKQDDFAVLRLTRMPACLVELGFITNKDDVTILATKWKHMAEAIAMGILKYHNIELKKDSDVLDGEVIFRKLSAYLRSLPTSEYAMDASKKGIASGLFVDGDNDGLIDAPRDMLTREQLAVVLERAGILKE